MADRNNTTDDAPQNWGQYTRMLGDLPLRSLPDGADGRLHAELTSYTSNPLPRQSWYLRALSMSASIVAITATIVVFTADEQPAPRETTRPAVISEEKPKRRHVRRGPSRREMAPQFGEVPIAVDTNIPVNPAPHHVPSDAVTGGDHRDASKGSGNPVVQPRPHSDSRSRP